MVNPRHDLAYDRLAMLYYGSGQLEELRELYRSWVTQNPDSVTARHMNAALSGETPPERASDEYVRETFNAFADSFDHNLTDLGYRAPQLIADAVRRQRATSESAALDVLDAGVGTGLAGPLLRGSPGPSSVSISRPGWSTRPDRGISTTNSPSTNCAPTCACAPARSTS